jgi:hypothetical protein
MAIRIFETQGFLYGGLPVRTGAPLATQTGVVGGSSTQSSTVNDAAKLVHIEADEDCHVAFGVNPTATISGWKINANEPPKDFAVVKGTKIAWIAAA